MGEFEDTKLLKSSIREDGEIYEAQLPLNDCRCVVLWKSNLEIIPQYDTNTNKTSYLLKLTLQNSGVWKAEK